MKPRIVSLIPSPLFERTITHDARQRLEGLGALSTNDTDETLPDQEVTERLRDAGVCLTGWEVRLPVAAIEGARRLEAIGHTAGSVKRLVPPLAFERGIVVLSASAIMAKSVGEMALGMAIAGLRNSSSHDAAFKTRGLPGDPQLRGKYLPRGSVGLSRTRGLHDATVGVVGASATGRYFIRLLAPFGREVRILVYDPYVTAPEAEALGVRKVDLEELLSSSDVVSLHAPATEETTGMIGERELCLMKDGALLVNTARGPLVDHEALYREASTGRINACLDVYFGEGCEDAGRSPFRDLPNVLITPGIAGPTAAVLRQMGSAIVEDLDRVLSGRDPVLRVDPDSLSHIA